MSIFIHSRNFNTRLDKPPFARSFVSSDSRAVGCASSGWGQYCPEASELYFQLFDEKHSTQKESGIPIDELLELTMKQSADKVAETFMPHLECDGEISVTSIAAAEIAESVFCLSHAGNCRAYLLRDGKLSKLTTDHTVIEKVIKEKRMSPDAARTSPYGNLVTNALGQKDCRVDRTLVHLLSGDRLLLCTSHLWQNFEDQDLEKFLGSAINCLENIPPLLADKRDWLNWAAVVLDYSK